MESRRIVLLIDGYLNGWLDFDYKQPTSILREELILREVERKKASNILSTRAVAEFSIALGSTGAIKQAFGTFQKLLETELPYLYNPDKLKKELKDDFAFFNTIREQVNSKKQNS